MKNRTLWDSFNCAITGIVQGIKEERNLKVHIISFIIVTIISKFLGISKIEFLFIFIISILVIITELLNTAIERVVDLTCGNQYHDLAKIAKDIAAGAVFLTALGAMVVGYIIFYPKINNLNLTLMIKNALVGLDIHVVILILLITFVLSILLKVLYGKEKLFLRGGMPSGHCSIAFAAATSILLIVDNLMVILLGYFLALLVAQSRHEGKIHSIIEIIIGSVLGVLVSILLYKILF